MTIGIIIFAVFLLAASKKRKKPSTIEDQLSQATKKIERISGKKMSEISTKAKIRQMKAKARLAARKEEKRKALEFEAKRAQAKQQNRNSYNNRTL